jgi:hypothetical protein
MPPKLPIATFAPTAVGAALLGLSAALLAVDVGGTVMLDAPSGTPERTAAIPPAAAPMPAEPAGPAAPALRPQLAAVPPAAEARPAPAPVTPVRHIYEPLAAAPSNRVAAVRRLTVLSVKEPRASAPRPMTVPRPRVIRPVFVALARPAQTPHVVAVPEPPKPTVTRLASFNEVRRFAIRRLTKSYPNISVISADTYSIGGGYVRVSMVVRNASERWVEKDVVKRSGTSLALAKSVRRGMPYAVASASQPLPAVEPNRGP